jgi:carbon-monoxide dehydrogenase large subunit
MIGPDEMPFTTRTQLTYDSGDYRATFDRAVELAESARRESSDRVRRGVGVAAMVEVTGFAPSFLLEVFQIQWSGWEAGKIRVNSDGSVTVFSGVTPMGQGIETTLAQVVADHLGVPMEWIAVQLGDTSTAPFSNFSSQASRSLTLAGAALIQAGGRMRERMNLLAANNLGVAVEDVELVGDVFRAGEQTIPWREVAHRGWLGWGRGDSDAIQLEEIVEFDPPAVAFAYAAHAAAVAVDVDTGKVEVEDYFAIHDSGVLVNPLIADGQVVGGIAQGLGIALLEEAVYDPATAQPLSVTYLDYAVPLSEDVPDITVEHQTTPSPANPGGFKGVGEGGTIPPAAAVGNAVAAAVPEIADLLVATPLAPSRVWTALDERGLTE